MPPTAHGDGTPGGRAAETRLRRRKRRLPVRKCGLPVQLLEGSGLLDGPLSSTLSSSLPTANSAPHRGPARAPVVQPIWALFSWCVELTCEHAELVTARGADAPPVTPQCAECGAARGVIVAIRDTNQRASDISTVAASRKTVAIPRFRPVTDEKWQRVACIALPTSSGQRRRPVRTHAPS